MKEWILFMKEWILFIEKSILFIEEWFLFIEDLSFYGAIFTYLKYIKWKFSKRPRWATNLKRKVKNWPFLCRASKAIR